MPTLPDWPQAAIAYLSHSLPRVEDDLGWDHMFSSSLQFGCMALIALGQADETTWGATARQPTSLPKTLPRWDDICVAVLCLAEQQEDITYLSSDGSQCKPITRPSHVSVIRPAVSAQPAANLADAFGLGAAVIRPGLEAVLNDLELVKNASWTKAAELVFWRLQPAAWQMRVTTDPRYASSLEQTLKSIPATIDAEIKSLVNITTAEIDATQAQHASTQADFLRRYGPNRRQSPQVTPEQAQQRLVFQRIHELDWLFFRHWRLPEGWLSGRETKRALEIFHDPLARAMRKSVLTRLYPDLTLFAL